MNELSTKTLESGTYINTIRVNKKRTTQIIQLAKPTPVDKVVIIKKEYGIFGKVKRATLETLYGLRIIYTRIPFKNKFSRSVERAFTRIK